MKTLSRNLLVAAFVIATAGRLQADQEDDLIAVLRSSADISAKCQACQQLRTTGTAKSVPSLAGLLGQDRLSQAARYALEGMPGSEATTALRDALNKTDGLNKAGVVDSLGWRRDTASVPALSRLLAGPDAAVASAAATALSRIGGSEAATALVAALDRSKDSASDVLLQALLRAADGLLAGGDAPAAARLFTRLNDPKRLPAIRLAAWRGEVMADPGRRADRLLEAMAAKDLALKRVALKLFRELRDPAAVAAGLDRWASLRADTQVAVVDAAVHVAGQAARAVALASKSPDPSVRVAAWEAVGVVNDTSQIALLAAAAAGGDPVERETARDSLTRLNGADAWSAFTKALDKLSGPEQAELLRAVGERGDPQAPTLLLQFAKTGSGNIRGAALEGLRRIASPDTLVPLLDLAAGAASGADAESAMTAAYAVCQASPDRSALSRPVLERLAGYTAAERRRVLPILPELGTPEALEVGLTAVRGSDPELRRVALRALGDWPSAAPADQLLALAKSDADPSIRALSLRGAVELVDREPDAARQLKILQQALAVASRTEEKRVVLGRIGQVQTPDALATVMPCLENPELVNEAGLAAVSIAEKFTASDPKLATDTANKVLAQCKAPVVVSRAWTLRGGPAGSGPFIQDWLVCGPFRQAGIVGATAIFPIAFAPEKGGSVDWKPMPRGQHLNLSSVFPGRDNCVAYLKTRVTVPAASDAMLLLGSDDGVKAWLNGEVVHSNNIDRGEKADEDKAPIHLKAGTNDLMLKISQGAGGWSVCARVVGADGQPVPGLRVEPPAAALANPKK